MFSECQCTSYSLRKGRIRSYTFLAFLISATDKCIALNTNVGNRRIHSLSPLHYRFGKEIPSVTNEEVVASVSAAFLNPIDSSLVHEKGTSLPTWLQFLDGTRSVDKWYELHNFMMPYLSEHDILILRNAILEASQGDPNKMAGATDFCRILVETMEMGIDVLVAAVFHYCTCVEAREHTTGSKKNPTYFWDEHYDYTYSYGIDKFREEAATIMHNAAKLKRTEMVASSLALNTGKSNSFIPNVADASNIRSLLLSTSEDWKALAIRSAACLYRLRGLLKACDNDANFRLSPEEIYVSREAFKIYAPLASRLGMHRLKNEIEDAAFKLLYHRQFEAVSSLTQKPRVKFSRLGIATRMEVDSTSVAEGMEYVLNELGEKIEKLLEQDETFMGHVEKVIVSARVKQPYSIWRKMLRLRTKNVLDVPDAIALRVVIEAKKFSEDEHDDVTRSRGKCLCYYVQKLFVDNWDSLNNMSKVKDYIMNPKKNGYQSLHFTASTSSRGLEWPFEMQIRSKDMHRTAQYGLAAHWDYKMKTKGMLSSEPVLELSPNELYSQRLSRFSLEDSFQKLTRSGSKLRLNFNSRPLSNPRFVYRHFLELNQIRADRAKARDEQLAPYIEAFSKTQSNLAKDHVFIFLSSTSSNSRLGGKILSLPAGACVIDALRAEEKSSKMKFLWNRNIIVAQNGSETNKLTERLNNGDILRIYQHE